MYAGGKARAPIVHPKSPQGGCTTASLSRTNRESAAAWLHAMGYTNLNGAPYCIKCMVEGVRIE